MTIKIVPITKAKLEEKDRVTTSDLALEAGKGLLDRVIILGIQANGDVFFSTNMTNVADINKELDLFKFDLLMGTFDENLQ